MENHNGRGRNNAWEGMGKSGVCEGESGKQGCGHKVCRLWGWGPVGILPVQFPSRLRGEMGKRGGEGLQEMWRNMAAFCAVKGDRHGVF